jgi:hypothetical protein
MRSDRGILTPVVGLLALAALAPALSACREGSTMEPLNISRQRLRAVPPDRWEALADRKIFFGHQSVGQNVVDGLRDILADMPELRIDIRETSDPRDFDRPVFAHSTVGRNGDPEGKIDHFRTLLENGIGERADVAFFKFCYADIDLTTDIEGLLAHYDRTIDGLRAKYPRLAVLVVSVPLTNAGPGLKSRIKTILGRDGALKAVNARRAAVNEHLRRTYGEVLWDLAAAESATAEGNGVFALDGGRRIELLNPAYSGDGGHLNDAGRRIVATDLLVRLAGIDGR